MSTSEQRSDSKRQITVVAKFNRGIPSAVIQDKLIEFENSYEARMLMQGGSIPDFTRMQDTYSFQFEGTLEIVTQYRKNDWWEDCHMSVYQQWRDDGRAKDIRKVARLVSPVAQPDELSKAQARIRELEEQVKELNERIEHLEYGGENI